MIGLLTQFGDSSSGLGALGLSGSAFIIQLITFVLAFLVLKRYAFGPILKVMDRRQKTIEQGVTLGEQMKKDKAELDAKVADMLHKSRVEADKILTEAHAAGRQAIQEAQEAAQKKVDGIIAASEERIKQDTARARKELEKDLAGLVGEATEVIIHEKVDTKKDASLIDEALSRGAKA